MSEKGMEQNIRENCTPDGKELKVTLPEIKKLPATEKARRDLEREYEKYISKVGDYIHLSQFPEYDEATCFQKADELEQKLQPIFKKLYTPYDFAYKFHKRIGTMYWSRTYTPTGQSKAIEKYNIVIDLEQKRLPLALEEGLKNTDWEVTRTSVGTQFRLSLVYNLKRSAYLNLIKYSPNITNIKKIDYQKQALEATDTAIYYVYQEMKYQGDIDTAWGNTRNPRQLSAFYAKRQETLKSLLGLIDNEKEKENYQKEIILNRVIEESIDSGNWEQVGIELKKGVDMFPGSTCYQEEFKLYQGVPKIKYKVKTRRNSIFDTMQNELGKQMKKLDNK